MAGKPSASEAEQAASLAAGASTRVTAHEFDGISSAGPIHV